MPTIYQYFGLVFLIHTRGEHEPIHVHVLSESRQSIIEIIRNSAGVVIDVRKKKDSKSKSTKPELSQKDLMTAIKFIDLKAEEFIYAWKLIEKGKKTPTPIVITRKLF